MSTGHCYNVAEPLRWNYFKSVRHTTSVELFTAFWLCLLSRSLCLFVCLCVYLFVGCADLWFSVTRRLSSLQLCRQLAISMTVTLSVDFARLSKSFDGRCKMLSRVPSDYPVITGQAESRCRQQTRNLCAYYDTLTSALNYLPSNLFAIERSPHSMTSSVI